MPMKKRRKNIVRNYVKYHKFNNMECYGSCFVAAVREGPANVDRRDSQDALPLTCNIARVYDAKPSKMT